ncbi:uncharacterized protein ACBT44_010880 [Syngnathus typhle]
MPRNATQRRLTEIEIEKLKRNIFISCLQLDRLERTRLFVGDSSRSGGAVQASATTAARNTDFSGSAALCFVETWLSERTPHHAVELAGFKLMRADRSAELSGKSNGGGVCFYINERWCTEVTVLKEFCSPLLETLFINCRPFYSPREFSSIVMAAVYIPPHARPSEATQMLADQVILTGRTSHTNSPDTDST